MAHTATKWWTLLSIMLYSAVRETEYGTKAPLLNIQSLNGQVKVMRDLVVFIFPMALSGRGRVNKL